MVDLGDLIFGANVVCVAVFCSIVALSNHSSGKNAPNSAITPSEVSASDMATSCGEYEIDASLKICQATLQHRITNESR